MTSTDHPTGGVLADIDARGITRIYNLGDYAGKEGYVIELRDGVYRGSLKAGESPDYHRRPR